MFTKALFVVPYDFRSVENAEEIAESSNKNEIYGLMWNVMESVKNGIYSLMWNVKEFVKVWWII